MSDDLPTTYYIDVSVDNRWKHDVTLVAPFMSKIHQLLVPQGNSRRKVFIDTGDSKPEDILVKINDIEETKNLLIEEDMQAYLSFKMSPQAIFLTVNNQGMCISINFTTFLRQINYVMNFRLIFVKLKM